MLGFFSQCFVNTFLALLEIHQLACPRMSFAFFPLLYYVLITLPLVLSLLFCRNVETAEIVAFIPAVHDFAPGAVRAQPIFITPYLQVIHCFLSNSPVLLRVPRASHGPSAVLSSSTPFPRFHSPVLVPTPSPGSFRMWHRSKLRSEAWKFWICC